MIHDTHEKTGGCMLKVLGSNDVRAADLADRGRTNASSRDRFEDYYDEKTLALVGQRDAFVAERFGYAPP